MSNSMRAFLIGMGLFFILLGIFLNFQLYTSLAGDSTLYKASYGLIGIGLDISKVLCLTLGVFLIAQGLTSTITAGIISLAFWLVLSAISLAAGWGFSLVVAQNYESQALMNSAQLQSAKATVENAQAKLDSASQYAGADITALTTRQQALENSLTALENTLDKCPANYFTNCITPTKAKIASVKSELTPLLAKINGYQSYQAAITHKETVTKQLAGISISSVNAESYMHPLFIGLAQIFNSDANTAKYRLLLVTFTAIELLGTLFFAIGAMFSGKREFTLNDLRAMEIQQQELKKTLGNNAVPLMTNASDLRASDLIAGDLRANDIPTQNNPDKKLVGGVYACVDCGTEYNAKVVWQKYCPTCSEKRRKGVLKANSQNLNATS